MSVLSCRVDGGGFGEWLAGVGLEWRVAGSRSAADATIGIIWVGVNSEAMRAGASASAEASSSASRAAAVVESERERSAALRVEGPKVGTVGLVGPRHGRARRPARGGELLAGELDGDGGVRERVDGVALGVGPVGQLGPGER